MREVPVSSCESAFLLEALWEGKRLDGRTVNDMRDLEITYGSMFGSCQVCLGPTRVVAQVSASVTEPRLTRPNEGVLFVNVELSPMAAPRFEAGRQSEEGVELNRTVERCLKESACVDLESLCIVTEEAVWTVRLDLHVLNHEGNLSDACSIAGLAALCHFRRPDVSLVDGEVVVHPVSERDPLPLAIHHHPVTSSFAMFSLSPGGGGETMTVLDPSRLEEACMQGCMVLGVNAYREICTLHLAGQVIINKGLVLKLAAIAADKAKKVVERIKACLKEDAEARKSHAPRGFAAALRKKSILQHSTAARQFNLASVASTARQVVSSTPAPQPVPVSVSKKDGVVEVVPDTMEEVIEASSSDEEEGSESDVEVTAVKSKEEAMEERITEKIELDDSEEEETVTLTKV